MRAVGKCFPVILVGASTLASCGSWTDQVTLINRANKDIKSVSVAIRNRAMEFGPLAPDQKITMTFTDAGEDGYHVIVKFADGRRLEGEVGYVTTQLSSTDTIDLYSDKIQLEGVTPVDLGKP